MGHFKSTLVPPVLPSSLLGDQSTQKQNARAIIWYYLSQTHKAALRTSLKYAPKSDTTLDVGYPKILKSDDVIGMAPGFYPIVLGICPLKDGFVAPLLQEWIGGSGGDNIYDIEIYSESINCPRYTSCRCIEEC